VADAVIANIQRSSVHDGPGFRTTVFFKGCQMRCPWCHNPETIAFEPEILHYPEKCIGCGQCDKGCFSGARVVCGRTMSVGDVFREIELDMPYYGADGGVTLSGGEPLCRPAFARELLERCREANIGAAIETNLGVPWGVAEPVLKLCSVAMADLKLWDESEHERWVGASNRLVKENLLKTAALGIPLILRTPVVPGVNATPEQIAPIAEFAAGLPNLKYYELLSYHPLGLSKSAALGREAQEFEKPAREMMERLAGEAAQAGVKVAVNGGRTC